MTDKEVKKKAFGVDWLDVKVKPIFVFDDRRITNGATEYYTETVNDDEKFISGGYTNEKYIFNNYDECKKFIVGLPTKKIKQNLRDGYFE